MSPEPKVGDADNELKERIARVLFANGYSCKYNVDVVSSYGGKTEQITDLDVVGVRFDPSLFRELTVADCKSGRDGTAKERLFWLAGVKIRYDAHRAFFVKQQVDAARLLTEYERLGLSIVSGDSLSSLEDVTDSRRFEKVGPVSKGSVTATDQALRLTKERNRPAYNYLRFDVWQDAPETQVETLIAIIRDLSSPDNAFARLTATSLLGGAVLSLAGRAVQVAPSGRDELVRAIASGGLETINHRRRLLDQVHAFTSAEIEKQTGKKWRVGRDTFATILDPPFTGHLIELVNRLLKNPAAWTLPRALDVLAFAKGISKSHADMSSLVSSQANEEKIAQSVGDVIAFLERTESISADNRKEYLSGLGA